MVYLGLSCSVVVVLRGDLLTFMIHPSGSGDNPQSVHVPVSFHWLLRPYQTNTLQDNVLAGGLGFELGKL